MSDGVVVTVRLTPRSGRDAIEQVDEDGVVHARVTAPPFDGAANKALVKLVARSLGVPRTRVIVVGGASSRVKRPKVGLEAREIEAHWPGVAVGGTKPR